MPAQGFQTLTRDHVSAVLDADSFYPADKFALLPIEMRFLSFAETGSAGDVHWNTSAETKTALQEWCRDAFACLDPSSGNGADSHVEQLDAHLSALMLCNFQTYKQKASKSEIVDSACALLARLPSHPPALAQGQDDDALWPAAYFVACPASTTGPTGAGQRYEWTHLKVLSRPSTNVVRLALFLVMDRSIPLGFTGQFSDTLVSLLDTTADLLGQSPTVADAQAWSVVQAFLWAAWQHTVMLQLWYDARTQMHGYRFDRHNDLIAKQIPSVMPRRETIEKARPDYMCKWAFELLRSDLSCVTQDFRQLFEIYEAHFGGRGPRCNLVASGPDETRAKRVCDGKAPGNCQRFESEGVQIQGAHDFTCPGAGPDSPCHLLTWDEQSYLDITGARAVSLEATDDKHIRYTPVTGDTMAVSHVWSHGQGGRPEAGFNSCLHRRYTALARALDCTSYWMDTPCVPTDRTLRAECIGQINANFENSKVTLLADRDIMEIAIHPRTLDAEQAILAALVVCDWNVRAWTLLEGMRGRAKLHILCKDNHVISLVDVLNDVLSSSCLSLVSPCLAVQHYAPTQRTFDGPIPVTIEQATCLLNHRHATKDRDVPMIWALVAGSPTVIKAAAEFWKSKVGAPLATGFLVSSSPRIKQHRGLGWAPARPNLVPPIATEHTKQYPAYDGQNSVPGRITEEGFQAEWLGTVLRRRGKGLPAWMFSIHSLAREDNGVYEYFRVYNKGGSEGMDMASRRTIGAVVAPLFKRFRYVALLMPCLRDRGTDGAAAPPRPFDYQGETEGLVVAVVASEDQREWEWQFVYEWESDCRLPEFVQAPFLLV
ncbi:hypothetical protein BDW62DRAFT_6346 [Aspergillus aurantiobrunneus]